MSTRRRINWVSHYVTPLIYTVYWRYEEYSLRYPRKDVYMIGSAVRQCGAWCLLFVLIRHWASKREYKSDENKVVDLFCADGGNTRPAAS